MIDQIIKIARGAGEKILPIYESDFSVSYKADASPLTTADEAAHDYICAALSAVSEIPIVSEEDAGSHHSSDSSSFWLVDPLDGTKEFLKRTGDFTVNIALISNGVPVLGVVYAPVKNLLYAADGHSAWKEETSDRRREIRCRKANTNSLCVVASKDHAGPEVEALLKRLPGAELASMGSSLKFCLVAEGKADFYPRFGPTMEWDTAAAHCVLASAGGAIYDLQGQSLAYNKSGFKNSAFVAVGDQSLPWKSWLAA